MLLYDHTESSVVWLDSRNSLLPFHPAQWAAMDTNCLMHLKKAIQEAFWRLLQTSGCHLRCFGSSFVLRPLSVSVLTVCLEQIMALPHYESNELLIAFH